MRTCPWKGNQGVLSKKRSTSQQLLRYRGFVAISKSSVKSLPHRTSKTQMNQRVHSTPASAQSHACFVAGIFATYSKSASLGRSCGTWLTALKKRGRAQWTYLRILQATLLVYQLSIARVGTNVCNPGIITVEQSAIPGMGQFEVRYAQSMCHLYATYH